MTTNSTFIIKTPALLAPNLVANVWGGDWLCHWKGLAPSHAPMGESWEFSTHHDHPGKLTLADGQAVPLSQVFGENPSGLLVKLIDARENLSLQVHPSDAYAHANENSPGKSESWLVLSTGPAQNDGFIYLGFSQKKRAQFSSEKAFAAAFEKACRDDASDVLTFVNKLKAEPGDVIHVPAGTVHAVGRGVRFFEVQQSSGLTYRLWDWGRRGRERHLEKAMSVLNFSAGAVRRHAADRITDPTGHYDAEIFSITNEHSLPAIAPFSVITVLEGEVGFNPGPACVREGWSVFVPEGVALTLSSSNARAVRSWTTTPRPSSA